MTLDQLQQLTTPARNTAIKVQRWFQSHQVHCNMLAGHSDWMVCANVTVASLESLLHAEFYDYTHSRVVGVVLPRSSQYSIPAHLEGHIDFISSIKRLPTIRTPSPRHTVNTRQGGLVTPQRSRSLFHVTATGNPGNGNRQEVAQFLGQFMTPSDLTAFWNLFQLPSVNYSIHGPNDPTNPGDEASLDIQTITGVNQGTHTWFTSTPGLHDKQVECVCEELFCVSLKCSFARNHFWFGCCLLPVQRILHLYTLFHTVMMRTH
jgi:subtilase family serine protease